MGFVHGRPDERETHNYENPKPVHVARYNAVCVGWRREHAHRCWCSMQALVYWLVAYETIGTYKFQDAINVANGGKPWVMD